MSFNREYKSTIFALLFNDPTRLLHLYNALNDTDYKDENDLVINTLEGSGIYMKYRNDVSFIFHSEMTLVEHQASLPVNMPLRSLIYITDLIKKTIDTDRLHGWNKITIPVPRFVVLYNGKEKRPLKEQLFLSSSFELETPDPELELRVAVHNITFGLDSPLLKRCPELYDYAMLVDALNNARESSKIREEQEKAATAVIDDFIERGILREFLLAYREDIVERYFWEYDEEAAHRAYRLDGYEDGFEEGLEEGLEKGLEEGREEGREEGAAKERENTERERQRADAAEAEIQVLKAELAKLTSLQTAI